MATLTVGIRHHLHGAESNQKSSGDRHGHNVEEVEEELLPRVLETAMSATLLSQEEALTLFFDRFAVGGKGGAGIVLTSPEDHTFVLSFELNFPCNNNIVEYEALLFGLSMSQEMGAENIRVIGDSNLVVKQVQGEFPLKEPALAPYRTTAQEMIKEFRNVSIEHISSRSNRYADALATLGSRIRFTGSSVDVSIIKKKESTLESMNIDKEPEAWRSPMKKSFTDDYAERRPKHLKEYTLLREKLYKQLPGEVLARCVGK